MAWTKPYKNGNVRICVSDGLDANGKQIVHAKTWHPDPNKTKAQNEKDLQREVILYESQCKGKTPVKNVKFQAFCETYLREIAPIKLKTRTVKSYRDFTKRIFPALGHVPLGKLTARKIQQFVTAMAQPGANPRTGEAFTNKTIRNYISFLSEVLSYAVQQGIIQSNPCDSVIKPKIKQSEKKIYTQDEMERFLSALDTDSKVSAKYRAFFYVAVYTGFRSGEMLGLRWCDVDYARHLISVEQALSYTPETGKFFDDPKTAQSKRTIMCSEDVFTVLSVLEAEQERKGTREAGLVFVNDLGEPLQATAINNWLKRFCERYDLPYYGVHMFRHFHATVLAMAGIDPKTISLQLGHSQVSTTMNIYAHAFSRAQMVSSQFAKELGHKLS